MTAPVRLIIFAGYGSASAAASRIYLTVPGQMHRTIRHEICSDGH